MPEDVVARVADHPAVAPKRLCGTALPAPSAGRKTERAADGDERRSQPAPADSPDGKAPLRRRIAGHGGSASRRRALCAPRDRVGIDEIVAATAMTVPDSSHAVTDTSRFR